MKEALKQIIRSMGSTSSTPFKDGVEHATDNQRGSGYEPAIGAPLLKQRGWTRGMIAEYLPRHARTRQNPKCRSWARMKLYSFQEVQRIESLPEFQRRFHIAKRAQRLAPKGIASKRQQTNFLVSRLPFPELPAIDYHALNRAAALYYCQRFDVTFNSEGVLVLEKDVVDVVAVKCLMHYDGRLQTNLAAVRGLVGAYDVRLAMMIETLARIAKAYPELTDACVYCHAVLESSDNDEAWERELLAMYEVASVLYSGDSFIRDVVDSCREEEKCA